MAVVVGVAVSGMGVAAIALLLLVVAGGVLVDRFGARQMSLVALALAGFFGPMNGLRLGASLTVTDLFLVPSLGLAIIARSHSSPDRVTRDRRPIRPDVMAALLLIAGGIVGSQFAENLGVSFSSIMRFGLAAVGVPLVFVAVGPSRRELRALAWAFLVGASVNSVIGVLTYNPGTRGIGLSTHANHLAVAALLASGLAAGLFLTSARRPALLAAGCWAVVSVGILKSGSRAGAAGAILVIGAVLLGARSSKVVRWCVAMVAGVAVLLFLNVIPYDEQNAIARLLGRNSAAVEQSNVGRAELRAEAIEAVKRHPLTGAGFEEARVAHNLYLQVWGAAGVLGLLGMAVLASAAVRGLVVGAGGDRWLLGAAAGVGSFLVIAVSSNILWDRYLWYGFALFVTGMFERPEAPPAPAPAGDRELEAVG